jgi:hypothetical protein
MSKKAILGGVVLTALALAPIGIKNIVDSTIQSQKSNLNEKGILLSIDNSKGYLNSSRDFTLTITDEVKFKEYFKDTLLQKYPIYEAFINNLTKSDTKKFDEFLKGIVFKGNIQSSNINPSSDIEVYTYLDKFSDEIMSKIKADEESKRIILPLFEKESLALNLLFDNKARLKTLVLKDIDENMQSTSKSGKKTEAKFQILGHKVINNSTDKAIIADVKFDKINIGIKARDNVNFLFNEMKYNINYKSQFINNGELKIKNISLKIDDNRNLQLGETMLLSSGLITNGIYSANSTISTSDFKLKAKGANTSLDDLFIDLNLNDLEYKNIEKLNSAYLDFESASLYSTNTKDRKIQMEASKKSLINELTTLVNNGLSLKVDTSVVGLKSQKLNLDAVELKLDAKLDKNDLSIKTFNKFSILTSLSAKAKLQMEDEDYKNISSTIHPRMAQIVSMYALKENGKVVFNLDLKKGKIEVNGKKIN